MAKSSKIVKKSTAKKAPAKKAPAKKVAAKKAPAKKVAAKKAPAKKVAAKKNNILNLKYEGDAQFLASIKPYTLKKKEKYMNVKQKNHFLSILDNWQGQLQVEQDRTAEKLQKNASNFPDEADRATHEEEFTLELRTRERERKLLSKINESIDDINIDDYGYCASCGIEIGIRRLEARPTATRCIDCKTIEEIHERQKYG
ncbi:MAG TPA: RNA polymerase-binding protein DksA [Gammaproteobacteria bacterium]|nr:RNA polymerase-binding protein DksA [Gammaproteobacteria bacterium]